jgi:hypothetical protein
VDVRGRVICPFNYLKTKNFLLYSTHKFKSLIHVFLFVACHLYMLYNVLGFYMLQNVLGLYMLQKKLTNNRAFIFWIHVMIRLEYCYSVRCYKRWKKHGQ